MIHLLILATTPLPPEMPPPPPSKVAPKSNEATGLLNIDPKGRSHDWVEGFELLRKEKPTLKLTIRLVDGTFFGNVTDIETAQNGTVLFIKILSNQGSRYMIVPIEQIAEMNYS